MNPIGQQIAEARRQSHLTQAALARRVGVSQSYISYIENGTRRIEVGLLTRIAEAVGCTPGSLLSSTPSGQIPVLGKVSAGLIALLDDGQAPVGRSASGEYLTDSTVDDENAFAAIVDGDSMSPRFNEGDRVIFSPRREARSGDYVLAKIDQDEGTFKQLFFEPDLAVRLAPVNPAYPARIIPRDHLHVCYPLIRRVERFG